MKPSSLLLILTLFFNCVAKAQNFDRKDIIGEWRLTGFNNKKAYKNVPFEAPRIEGISFFKNNTYDNKDGFFKNAANAKIYLGSVSQFKISTRYLSLFNLSNRKWVSFTIIVLKPNYMQLAYNGIILNYARVEPHKQQLPTFDRIILTSRGCFDGECPAFSVSIDATGQVIFRGLYQTLRTGFYKGTISKQTYHQLESNFSKINIDTIKKLPHVIDAMTMSTTFIKGGKIYKTIFNSDHDQSKPLRWAYIPLENLYQQIQLKEEKIPSYLENVDLRYRAGDKVIDMKPSEEFLLLTYLINGKTVDLPFKTKFRFRAYKEDSNAFENLYTDGRYYQFIVNGKPLIIDIGFNFYDVNAKKIKWLPDTYR